MIKKLDTLILKTFIGPFIVTFFLVFFVLMLQNLWKYIDDLVGKGLDFITIGKFLWYAGASLLTLTIPIAILISSIMTFGNMGERFELVAIKSAGISLLRFMRPLMWVAILLSGVTFLFANYVIPYANLRFKTLYNDILYKRPALDLKEGTFFTYIQGYAIKVGKKDPDGKKINNVLIYEQQNNLQDNSIIAETGIMKASADKQFLEFTLQNGNRYQERGSPVDTSTEFIQMGFKEYKKLIDLSSLQMSKTSDSAFRNDYKMRSVRQLNVVIDSLQKEQDSLAKKINREVNSHLHYAKIPDSVWKKVTIPAGKYKNFTDVLPDSAKNFVFDVAFSSAGNIRSNIQYMGGLLQERKVDLRKNKTEWHRKFSLSLACLVLFFIGAPLGSIIRKGGLGMPLVVAIIFFLIFHLLNMFGEKFVKEGIMPPYLGMWLAVIVLTPLCLFLTYKAMHDSQLFNKEFYYRIFRKMQPAINILRRAK